MWANFNTMPTLLKFLTAHALGCFILLVGSVIPHHSFSIYGRAVSYSEWWSSGAGFGASALGILMPIAGVLLLKKRNHARIAYLGVLSLSMIAPYPIMREPSLAVVGAVFVGIVSLYLYFYQPVQTYFASNPALKRDALKRAP